MLTVVTHVNRNRNIDISRCIDSIDDSLCGDARHLIISNYSDFLKARHEAVFKKEGFIAFIDDDDFIERDCIKFLNDAINKNTRAGIIFSNEKRYYSEYDIISEKAGSCYEDLLFSASKIHHICAINSEYITKKSIELALQANCGIEWCMKAEAGLAHGAVHINEFLYNYVQHKNQLSCSVGHHFKNCKKIFLPQFAKWQKHFGEIPLFNLEAH